MTATVTMALALLGCSEPAPANADGKADADANANTNEAAVAVAEPSTPSSETPVIEAADGQPGAEPGSPPTDPSPPEAVAPDSPPSAPGLVPTTVVTPVDFEAAWRELASPSEALSFVSLDGGVLASSASGLYELDDTGQLVLNTAIEAWPAYADLLGVWPADVWYIERREADSDDRSEVSDELRLMRLRGGKRWVPQEYEGEQRFVDEGQEFQLGAKGGLIVTAGDTVTRVAGGADDPALGEYKGSLIAFAETRSGRIYTITRADEAVWVQRDCADAECVTANALQLPLGNEWSFAAQVPRQRHSVSVIASVEPSEGAKVEHLLHYEAGGWKLESLPRAPEHLWPSKDGGLWTKLGDELWHRDPDAAWRKVALPGGISSVSVALRGDANELWITGMVGAKPAVYAIHANVQDPAPAAAPGAEPTPAPTPG